MNTVFQNPAARPAARIGAIAVARIGQYPVAADAVARFNAVLGRLGRPPMGLADLAATARRASAPPARQASTWIVRRMRRGLTVGLMLADPCWAVTGRTGEAATVVADYLARGDDLIPDEVPRIGRLDDALVVDAAWPLLADEVRAYLDYCGVRRIEAGLRGCPEHAFPFSRADAGRARAAQRALAVHFERVGLRSYLPASRTPRFRVC
jgi:uncharacterized membrane protein YkvA (DUF1232 family)